MSRSVEERIVEMQFDNAQFESGVKTSIKSLNQLEQSLQLKGATRGIEEVEKASKRLDMSTLLGAIDAVGQKISKLDSLGQMYIRKWKNEAINLVRSVAKEFTINPVKTGIQEYETQINSIQTILANTKRHGSTLADVNAALDDLNYYADKTIYNFTQMTNAIGMFTTQGVELERSTESVKGIANLAAFVGAPASDATRAMYQLSQALSLGSVRLQDWMSLEHTAGMAGKEFQDRLIATARIHNTGVDAALEKNGNFRESLKEGWLTTEVLTETLKQFTETTDGLTDSQIQQKRDYWRIRGYTEQQIDDIFELGKTATDAATKVKTFTQLMDTLKEAAQSGWTRSWQLIIGDFEEAKELLTSLSDRFGKVIEASANSRNKVLEDWKNLGGRQVLIDAFDVVFKIGQDLSASITKAFQSVFPSLTGKQLADLTSSLKNGLDKIEEFLWSPVMTGKEWPVIYYISQAIEGLVSPFKLVWEAIKGLFSGLGSLLGQGQPFMRWIIQIAGSLGKWLSNLTNAISKSAIFKTAINLIASAIGSLANKIMEAGHAIKVWLIDKFEAVRKSDFGKKMEEVFSKIASKAPNAGKALSEFGENAISSIKNSEFLQTAFEKLKSILEPVWTWIKQFGLNLAEGFNRMLDADTSGITSFMEKVKAKVNAFLSAFNSTLSVDKVKAAWEKFKSIFARKENSGSRIELGGLTAFAEKLQNGLKNVKTALSGFSVDGTILSALDAGVKFLGGILERLFSLNDYLNYDAMKGLLSLYTGFQFANMMQGIGQAGKGLANVGGTLAESIASFTNALSGKLGGEKIEPAVKSFDEKVKSLATSLLMIAGSVLILSRIPVINGLDKALLTIGGLAAFAIITAKSMPKEGLQGNGFQTLAKSVLMMSLPIKILSGISWEGIGKALVAMGGITLIIAGLTAMSKKMKNHNIGFTGASQFVALAGALDLMMGPILILSFMSWGQLGKAAGAIGFLALIIAGLTALMKKTDGNGFSGGVQFLALTAGLNLMLIPMMMLSIIPLRAMTQGLVIIGVIGLIMAGLSKLMNSASHNNWAAPVQLLAISTALNLMLIPITMLSMMKWKDLKQALIGIGTMSLCIAVLNLTMKSANSVGGALKGALKAIISMIPIVGMMWVLTEALQRVSNIEPAQMTSFAISFAGVMATLALAALAFKAINIGGAAIAGASMVVLITAIALAAKIFAGIAGSALTTFTNSLNIVGPNLKYFSEQIASLSEGGFQAAADCIGIMAAAFKDVVGVNLNEVQNFTYALTDIGYGLYAFNNLTKDVIYNPETEKDVEFVLGLQNRFNGFDSTAISTALLDVATSFYLFNSMMAESGGTGSYQTGSGTGFAKWLKEVIDELPDDDSIYQVAQYADESSKNSMYGFAQGLTAIGHALSDYGKAFDAVDTAKVDKANETVGLMGSLESKLNPLQRVIGRVLGIDDDLSRFGTRIGELGVGVGNYIKSIADAGENVTADKINLAGDTLRTLMDLEKDLPNTGNSIWNWFKGATSLQDFGGQLVSLGSNLSEFFVKIGEGDLPSDIDRRIEVASTALSSFLGIKTNSGIGAIALEDFTKGMPAFVPNIKTFLEGLSGINADFNKADKVLAYVRQFKEQKDDLNDVMTALGGFADKAVWGNNGENFNAAINGIAGLFSVLEKGQSITSGDVSWLSQLFTQMDEASIAEAAAGLATSFFGSFGGAFTELLNGVAENVTTACEQLWLAGSNELGGEPAKAAWETAGSNLTLGFANGIRSQIGSAVDAATALGNAAASALNTSLDEHSPSKRTLKSGVFFNEGFINGMTSTIGQVANAAADVGISAVNNLEKSGFLAGLPQNGRLTAKLNIGSDVHAVSGNDAADKGSPSTIGGAVGDAIDRGVNKLKPWLNDPIGQIKDTVDKAGKRVGEVVDGAKSLISGDWDGALEGIFGKDAYTKAEAIYDMVNGDLSKVDQLYPEMDAETKKLLTQFSLYGKNSDEKVNGASSGSSGSRGNKNESGTASSGSGKGTGSYSYAQASSAGDKLRELTRIRDLFEAINSVGLRVNDLGEAVANMQIVMDSGVMVGQIETKMDSRLGSIAGVKGRGL